MNDCPHWHVCGMFGGSHLYLRCNRSLNFVNQNFLSLNTNVFAITSMIRCIQLKNKLSTVKLGPSVRRGVGTGWIVLLHG